MNVFVKTWPAFLVVLLAVGCGQNGTSSGSADNDPPDRGKYLLPTAPGGAKGVKELRKEARDGDEVVVVGRVGGSGKPFVAGRAAFTLVDLSLEPCEDDGCGNPWCSADSKELKQGTTLVKFVDDQGKTLEQDAEKFLGLKLLQTLVIRGQAKRDAQGNLTVLASGLHVKP